MNIKSAVKLSDSRPSPASSPLEADLEDPREATPTPLEQPSLEINIPKKSLFSFDDKIDDNKPTTQKVSTPSTPLTLSTFMKKESTPKLDSRNGTPVDVERIKALTQPPTPPSKNLCNEDESQPDHEDVNTIRKHLFDSPAPSATPLTPLAAFIKKEGTPKIDSRNSTPVDIERIKTLTQPPTPPCKNLCNDDESQPDHEDVNTIRKHLFDSPAPSVSALNAANEPQSPPISLSKFYSACSILNNSDENLADSTIIKTEVREASLALEAKEGEISETDNMFSLEAEAKAKLEEQAKLDVAKKAESDPKHRNYHSQFFPTEEDEKARLEAEEETRLAEAEVKAKAEKAWEERLEAETKARAEAQAKEEAEFEEKARVEAETKVKAAEEQARLEADAKAKAEEQARLEAEAKAKAEAEEKARHEAEEQARLEAEAEEKARIEAEEQVRLEVEAKAKAEAEEKARLEAEEKARLEAEEKARLEAEEKARLEAEAKAKAEAEEKARHEAEEQARLEVEAKAKAEAEEKASLEAEEKARLEAEAKTKAEAEEKVRLETEEQVRLEVEAKAKAEAEEKARLEAEENARLEAEAKAKSEAKEQARLVAEAISNAQAEKRARIAAEDQARLGAEAKAKFDEVEQARLEADAMLIETPQIQTEKPSMIPELDCHDITSDITPNMDNMESPKFKTKTKLDFNPFDTKSNVVNDGEDKPLPSKKASVGAYNLDFLDQLDDPNFNPFETKSSVVNEGEPQPDITAWKKPKIITPTARKQDKLHPVSSSPQSQEIADVAVAAETSVATVSCSEKTRENAVGSTEQPQPTTIKDTLELEQKLDVSSSLNKHDIATVVETEAMMLKQDSPSQISSTSSKPTAIVKPQSEMKVEMKVEETTNEENKSDLVTDDKPKKKPLPPKPWLKKKRKANPSTKQTANDESSTSAPASTGNGYNLDFLDKLDDPNFNPFATKASVVNDGEQFPVSKPAGGGGGGYNLDFLDKADLDDPNFNPFETKSKVVIDDEDSSSSPILPTSSPGKTQKVEAYLDDPNFNPFETKTKVVLDNDSNSSKTTPTFGQGKTQKVETEQTSLPSDLPALELCEPPPESKTGPVPPRIENKEKFVKKDSTPEFEAAEQQIFDDDISFQVSNISDLKEHLFNDNDLEEPYQEKDLTEPSFLLSATNRSTEATGNGNSRLDSKMPLETSSSLTQAQSPPCLSILKDTQRANNFVKNSQNEQPDPKNTILQPTKRDTKQKIRSEKVREEMARNELFYQSQLLEKDKALHQKEKEIQLVDQEVQQLKQVKFSFSEKATKICAIFLMVWAWMFTK